MGPLQPLIEDQTVTDINMVNGYREVYVERSGKLQKPRSNFVMKSSFLNLARRIKEQKRVDESMN
ncbi:hypothetical protein OH492_14285 [Vibrio chagasii]|nr:hypothetical protein [Vibrio chagasii]